MNLLFVINVIMIVVLCCLAINTARYLFRVVVNKLADDIDDIKLYNDDGK